MTRICIPILAVEEAKKATKLTFTCPLHTHLPGYLLNFTYRKLAHLLLLETVLISFNNNMCSVYGTVSFTFIVNRLTDFHNELALTKLMYEYSRSPRIFAEPRMEMQASSLLCPAHSSSMLIQHDVFFSG